MNLALIQDICANVELFKDLSPAEQHHLVGVIEETSIQARAFLFRENSPRDVLYIINTGQIELTRKTPFGTNRRLIIFGQNDFFGEAALLDDSPRSTSAQALSPTKLFLINRDKFSDFARSQPGIANKILFGINRVITRRMQQATTRLVNETAQYFSGQTRAEHDLLGTREVPYEAYYGIQTLRAIENFHITGVPLSHYPLLVEALAMVKMAAAKANHEVEQLPSPIADAISQACRDILQGKFHNQFVVDMIQGGAGTSTNMNANEVIANRALEILGHPKGDYQFCHPNNHVNCSQSTNDAYPTALKIAILKSNEKLVAALQTLIHAFQLKAQEFAAVIKMGRTQLQDAVPMTLGQEFGAYAVTLGEETERLNQNARLFLEINMGGTAIGTELNTVPEYKERVLAHLIRISGLSLSLAPNLIEATQDTGAFLMYSSTLKRLAVKLSKICNDLRLLSSGPRTGLNEINLPKMQPGSSIMPGKVNPVIPEVVNQIAFKVIGNDLTVTLAAEAGQLELNVMEPVIAQSIFESIEMLKNGITTLKHRCVDGISANREQCRQNVEKSIGLVTALVPVLGYEICSNLAKEALATNRGIYELVLEKKLLSTEELNIILDPDKMLSPQIGK